MRPELGTLCRVQAALKQGPKDTGLDELPVRFCCVGQDGKFLRQELVHGGILEKVSIEVTDFVCAECATLGHGPEQVFQALGKE